MYSSRSLNETNVIMTQGIRMNYSNKRKPISVSVNAQGIYNGSHSSRPNRFLTCFRFIHTVAKLPDTPLNVNNRLDFYFYSNHSIFIVFQGSIFLHYALFFSFLFSPKMIVRASQTILKTFCDKVLLWLYKQVSGRFTKTV